MSGKLLQMARRDIAKITQGGGFEEDILFSNPLTGEVVELKGLHSKHWIQYDTDGNPVNSKNAHISIMESALNEKGIITRSEKTGNVEMKPWFVTVKDSTGVPKNYIINEIFPSETTGLVVCILGDYKP